MLILRPKTEDFPRLYLNYSCNNLPAKAEVSLAFALFGSVSLRPCPVYQIALKDDLKTGRLLRTPAFNNIKSCPEFVQATLIQTDLP